MIFRHDKSKFFSVPASLSGNVSWAPFINQSKIYCMEQMKILLNYFLYIYIPVGPKASPIEIRLLSSLGHYQTRAIPDIVKIVSKNWFFCHFDFSQLQVIGHTSDVVNTLGGPRKIGRHFADIFKCIFLGMKIYEFSIKISLKFVPKGPVDNIPALVQIMAWRRHGVKP